MMLHDLMDVAAFAAPKYHQNRAEVSHRYTAKVVTLLYRRYVPARKAGTIVATGTTPHTATAGRSHL